MISQYNWKQPTEIEIHQERNINTVYHYNDIVFVYCALIGLVLLIPFKTSEISLASFERLFSVEIPLKYLFNLW